MTECQVPDEPRHDQVSTRATPPGRDGERGQEWGGSRPSGSPQGSLLPRRTPASKEAPLPGKFRGEPALICSDPDAGQTKTQARKKSPLQDWPQRPGELPAQAAVVPLVSGVS